MRAVSISASHPYEVRIGSGLLSDLGAQLRGLFAAPRSVMVVSDDTVSALYGPAAERSLRDAGFCPERFVFPHGERSKTLSTYAALQQALLTAGFTRSDLIVALGGGVAGDLAGFAAATYQRGIPYVQVPTTLLSAVDSSVGGKTAVNLPGGKNQVGAFHQPALVLCDPDLLHSLPPQEYQNGCGELVKYAMLSGDPLYSALLSEPVSRLPEQVISACVEIKRDFVQSDEWDTGCRRLLNFGHTVEGGRHVFYFHGAAEGRKVDLVRRNGWAGFELDTGYRLQGAEAACGYTAAFQSVIGEGPIRVVETAEEKRRGLAAIMHQATCCGDWTFPDAAVDAVCVLRLDAEELSCKEHL